MMVKPCKVDEVKAEIGEKKKTSCIGERREETFFF